MVIELSWQDSTLTSTQKQVCAVFTVYGFWYSECEEDQKVR